MVATSFQELYPFQSHYLPLDGLKYHYLDEGSGDPLIMLHGNPTWSFYYRRLIAEFRKTYRVIAPDHMGCGFSDKPQTYAYRLAQHIDNLDALLQHLDLKRVTLCLHDWGGPIGMGWALRHPERISRFVIFNTAAFPSSRIPLRINLCKLPVVGDLAIRRLNAFAGLALTMATAQPQRMTRAVKDGYLAPYDSYANRITHLRFVQDIPMHSGHPTYALINDIGKGLARFRQTPMLIIWGEQDWCFTPEFLERWVEYFPHAKVRRVSDAGHYVVEDAYERIIPWLHEFLAAHPLT